MTDRKTAVSELLAMKAFIKELEREHDRRRAELGEHFTDAGEREVGMLLDHRLGTVSLEAGREYWTVVDEEAFLSWVMAFYRHETTPAVRPAFRTAVLERCKRDGGMLYTETGEINVPWGVDVRKGAPTLVERTDKHAGFVVRHWLGVEATEKLGIEAGNG
jgi:hypothetical protein